MTLFSSGLARMTCLSYYVPQRPFKGWPMQFDASAASLRATLDCKGSLTEFSVNPQILNIHDPHTANQRLTRRDWTTAVSALSAMLSITLKFGDFARLSCEHHQ